MNVSKKQRKKFSKKRRGNGSEEKRNAWLMHGGHTRFDNRLLSESEKEKREMRVCDSKRNSVFGLLAMVDRRI